MLLVEDTVLVSMFDKCLILLVAKWTSCNTAVISSSCYKLVIVNLVTTCYVRAISNLLGHPMELSTLLQDANNLFQICPTTGSKQFENSTRTCSKITCDDTCDDTCSHVILEHVHVEFL